MSPSRPVCSSGGAGGKSVYTHSKILNPRMRAPEGDWSGHVERLDGVRIRRGRPLLGDGSLPGREQIVLKLMDPFGAGWSLPTSLAGLRDAFSFVYGNRVEVQWLTGSGDVSRRDAIILGALRPSELPAHFLPHESCPACDLARVTRPDLGNHPEDFWPHRIRPVRLSDSARWDLLTRSIAKLEERGAVARVDDPHGVCHWYVTPNSREWTREWRETHETFLRSLPSDDRAKFEEHEEGRRRFGERLVADWRHERQRREEWLAGEIVSGIRRTERDAAFEKEQAARWARWKKEDAAEAAAFRRKLERIRKGGARSLPARKSTRPKKDETAESLMLELDATAAEIMARAPVRQATGAPPSSR